jgi:hypothetical protein
MNQELSDLFGQYDIGGTTQANFLKEIFDARDKWWIGLLQEVNEANDLKDLQERFAHLLRYTADLEAKE